MLCSPAFLAANHLLSPAIISNLVLSEDFLTIIGCITPRSFIELVKSSKFSLSKSLRGWNLFGSISLSANLFVVVSTLVSPIKDDKPLPNPFFNFWIHYAALPILFSWIINSSVKL